MVVVVIANAPNKTRGTLRNWLVEVTSGVFVGTVSERVRDELWQLLTSPVNAHYWAVLCHASPTMQGFERRTIGLNPATLDDAIVSTLRALRPPSGRHDLSANSEITMQVN